MRKQKIIVVMIAALAELAVGPVAASTTTPGANAPALHVQREGQNVSEIKVLKAARHVCLLGNPAGVPEPDWSKVAITREEEFFSGKNYALYREWSDDQIAETSCGLVSKQHREAEIDDGAFHYELNLTRGTGVKKISRAILEARQKEELARRLRENPAVAKALADMAQANAKPETLAAMKQTQRKLEERGHDSVAGQSCDYIGVSGAELCHWSKMHEYPGTIRRPIILKTKIAFGEDTNIARALVFEENARIDNAKFQPPAGITLQDRTKR